MLKTRVITAVVFVPLLLAAVFALSAEDFRWFLMALFLLGCWEYRALAALNAVAGWVLFISQATLLWWLNSQWELFSNHSLALLVAGVLTWCVMFLRLLNYRENQVPDFGYRFVSFMSALAEGTFAWYSLAWIRDQEHGSWMIFALLLLVWIADTGAYFVGRRFGRRKLAPKISPGKTVEGLLGGLLLSALVLTAAAHASGWVTISPFLAFPLLLLIGLTSVGGDLFISLQKRTVRLADTGRLLPGHGGIYDRFDSLAASAPFFALALLLATK